LRRWLILGLATALIFAAPESEAAKRGCGSRGGPGYRDQKGKCVGWDELDRVCGRPPETRCTKEG
jgi:hypothetical protein